MSSTVETKKKPIDYVKEGSGYADITLLRPMKVCSSPIWPPHNTKRGSIGSQLLTQPTVYPHMLLLVC